MKTDKTVIGDATIWWRYNQPVAFYTPSTGAVARDDYEGPPYATFQVPADGFTALYDEAIANKLKETT